MTDQPTTCTHGFVRCTACGLIPPADSPTFTLPAAPDDASTLDQPAEPWPAEMRRILDTVASGEREVRVVDGADMALVLTVTKDGVADAKASVPKPEVARMLRHIADHFDPEGEAQS